MSRLAPIAQAYINSFILRVAYRGINVFYLFQLQEQRNFIFYFASFYTHQLCLFEGPHYSFANLPYPRMTWAYSHEAMSFMNIS